MINNQMTVIPFNEPPSYPYSYCEYSGKEFGQSLNRGIGRSRTVESPAGYILSYTEGV